jgi:hypothetical protein
VLSQLDFWCFLLVFPSADKVQFAFLWQGHAAFEPAFLSKLISCPVDIHWEFQFDKFCQSLDKHLRQSLDPIFMISSAVQADVTTASSLLSFPSFMMLGPC